ncbi:MAG: phosphoglycerate mutase [Chloroflexi bacterium]|nr:phosphoglycerate mutase [Chloroflexota bacterium]
MTILLLIRHASNDYLKENRLAGLIPGIHLNEQGQREADALARRLESVALDAIYSSPIDRARETAHAVAQNQKLDVRIHPGLIEVDVGEWTGRLISELVETDAWKQLLAQPVAAQFPGGDSFARAHQRIVAAVDTLVAAHPDQIIALVSHADPIKIALAHYLKMDLNQFNRIVVDPASVSVLKFNARGPVLERLNDRGERLFEKKDDSRKE